MTSRKGFVERRKQDRFKVKEGAFVEFHKPPLFQWGKPRIVKTASIIDISIDGLAFQYIDLKMLSLDFYTLSISNITGEIKINEIPFKAISDFAISRVSSSEFIRRCGIKFEKLTPNQQSQLRRLIQHYAG